MKKIKWILLGLTVLLVAYISLSDRIQGNSLSGDQEGVHSTMLTESLNSGLNQIRVMTYNIHIGKGMDDILDLTRTAQVIIDADVDIVGINEFDVRMPRTRMANQPRILSEMVGMNVFFGPALDLGIGKYGNGVLSRVPLNDPINVMLPRFMQREPRAFVQFGLIVQERYVRILITHLGLNPVERQNQLDFLVDWLKEIDDPVILMGDFNIVPSAPAMQDFLRRTGLTVNSYEPTFPADEPKYKIDYILTSSEWEAVGEVEVIQTLASDHLPVVGSFRLKNP